MTLDPQSRAVVNALYATGILPFRRREPAVVRDLIRTARSKPAVSDHPVAHVVDEQVSTDDGEIPIRILTPRLLDEGTSLPAVIYLPGGGFFSGGIDQTDEILRRVARDADVVVFIVAYRLAPEWKFPTAVNDAYAALLWVAANAARFGADPARVVLAGDSAGGNLAIVTCLTAAERRGQAGQLPGGDLSPARPREAAGYASRRDLGDAGFVLDNGDLEWAAGHYPPDRADADDWRASPIVAPSFAVLPPALMITADHNPLVDEGRLYADRLAADGVAVEYRYFEGTFHGFVNHSAHTNAGATALDWLCDRIRRATLS